MRLKFYFLAFAFLVFFVTGVSAQVGCNLNAQLINQDPYPAVPGEKVKVVFQVTGVGNPSCGNVLVDFVEEYPFKLDPSSQKTFSILGGTFVKDYSSFLMVPYTLIVDKDSVDGERKIKLHITGQNPSSSELKEFSIEVKDVRTDFEVYVRSYDSQRESISFDVINVGKNRVEAVTVEIPQQNNFLVRGSMTNVIGSLDSKEDVSVNFNALVEKGEIEIVIKYSDAINERREVRKSINFDPKNFEKTVDNSRPLSFYLLIGLILLIVVVWGYKKLRKPRKKSD